MGTGARSGRARKYIVLAALAMMVFAVAWHSGRRFSGAETVIRVYDIRDLLVEAPSFDNAPSLGIAPLASNRNWAAKASASGTTVSTGTLATSLQSRIDEIIRLIRASVDPPSWERGPGVLTELRGRLVITQTAAAHEQIQRLLHDLAAAQQVQITIDARFVWLDEQSLTTLPKELRERLTPNSAARPADASSLTEFEVNLILIASQASQKAVTLTCPRITLFSGQRAYVLTGTQRSYVQSISESVYPAGQTTRTQNVDVITSGILLDVQAAASADHQLVTLTLRPEMSELTSLNPAAPSTTLPTTPQIPVIDYKTLRTTVTVKPGMTYLLSGFIHPPPALGATRPAATQPADSAKSLYLLVKPTLIAPAVNPNARVILGGKQ